jgi:SNF2 family DNA or RNA helicase
VCPHGFADDKHCYECQELASFLQPQPWVEPTVELISAQTEVFNTVKEITNEVRELKFDGHKVWECLKCDGNGFIACQKDDCDNEHGCEEIDCDCQCHIIANTPIVEEKPKTQREKLDEMIAAGTAKKVRANFAHNSTIHQEPCAVCGQIAIEVTRTRVGNLDIIELECMHTLTKSVITPVESSRYKTIKSLDGYTPYDFQATGAAFLDTNNGRGLIADEMGLGKTIQALIWLKEHKEAWPFIIVTKASLKVNWYREIVRWIGNPLVQILDSSNEVPVTNVPFIGYIVSVDTIGRATWTEDIEDHEHIKTVVLDECQTIKNMNAKRTKQVRNLCQGKDHIIALSGTPIKNNAVEYFPVLNLLRPEKFHGQKPFINKWVEVFNDGYTQKAGGIRADRLDEWNDLTKDFIIRRKREEVLPDLPKIMRTFQYHDLGENVRKAYSDAFDDFMEASSESGAAAWGSTLAAMSRMRHLTGIAKIEPCVDYVTDFLVQNENEKICIFAHHKDVIGGLTMMLDEILRTNGLAECSIISGDTPAEIRQELLDEFRTNPRRRVMVLSTLAAGEGLNIQFVKNAIVLERQWNPANEEQAEGRFSRIGSIADSISAMYLVAIDTIDEFFAKLVEQKRSFMSSTLDGKEYRWDETNLMKELAEQLRNSGRKPWMLQQSKVKY